MPSTQNIERPQAALAVAKQYLRRERLLSTLLVVVVMVVFLVTYLATSAVPATVVGALLVLITRAPLLQPHGTVRLRTEDGIDAVVSSFMSPTPPVLAFQWGIADAITRSNGAVTYQISYLLGLRSVEMTVYTQQTTTPGGEHRMELEVTAADQSWATYTAVISQQNSQTHIEYEYTANRRFGLRRLPQRIVAARYRDAILAAQEYTVVERNEHYYGF